MTTTDKIISIIDIGSNSVRLKIFTDGKILLKRREVPRLGQGVYQTQKLSNESIEKCIQVLKDYVKISSEYNASIYTFATAAVRTAKNKEIFLNRVKEETNLDVDVVSGELEAKLGLYGALGSGVDGAIIDIGGNSTEISKRENGQVVYSKSISIGAVKLKDICNEDMQKIKDTTKEYVGEFDVLPLKNVHLIGGSGTCYGALVKGDKADGFILKKTQIEEKVELLRSMSVEERKKLKGMEPTKADVIVGGGVLLLEILDRFNLDSVIVTESDNLEGYAQYVLSKE